MSIKKSISFTFGAQIINSVIGFISSIIITRILGAEGRGENAIFSNAIAFSVLFFGFSISSTIPYFINSGKAKAEELLTTVIIFIFSSTILVFTTLFLLERAGKLHWALPDSIQSLQFKLIFTGIYFVTLLNGVLNIYLITYKKFKEVSIYSVVFQGLPVTVYLLLYFNVIPYNHKDPFTVIVFVTAILSLVSIVAISFLFIKLLPVRPGKKLVPLSLIRKFVFFSSMAYIGNVAQFFNYKLDFWVVDSYFGKSQLGIYSLAAQLSQLLWMLPSAIATVLYSYASIGSREDAINFTVRLKQIAFYGTLFLGVTGLFLSYYLIPILYGNEFKESFNLMKLFIIGIVPFSITTIVSSFFAARGNFKISFFISVGIFMISTIMYFTLIPRFGLRGGAIGSSIAYLIASILSEIWFCKEYKVSYLNLFQIDKSLLSLSGLKKIFKS
ncbi:MAG: polysaccharide biosynthesis C-terminal domain-containing protein [Bacteroidota bacterium]|nr:polysaccharide biosynthesis C-terminal domain-containing protein [Bacteroidota bacterium]